MHLFAAAAVIGWIARARSRRIEEWLLCGAFGAIFFQAIKNFGYFAIVAAPAAAEGWTWIGEQAAARLDRRRRNLAWSAAGAAVTGFCAVLIVQVANGYYYGQQRSPDRMGHRFNADILPVRAGEFLTGFAPPPRILNSWDNGGYLSFATRRPVFVYGWNEVHGADFYLDYLRFKNPRRMPAQLAKWHQNAALVPHNELPQWFAVLAAHREWRCVYADDVFAVFFHASYAPEAGPWRWPEAGADRPADEDELLRRGAARRMPSLLASLARTHYEPRRELRLTALALLGGNPEAAVCAGLEGLRRATFPAPELLLNMGHAYYALREADRAAFCYASALNDLTDELARSRLEKLRRRAPAATGRAGAA
jgi:hypothetical protein